MDKKRCHNYLQLLLSLYLLSGLLSPAVAEVTLDGSLGPAGPIAGPDYLISDTVGSRSATNLFHSFGKFNIGTSETATFTNTGAPIENVLARVTGGASSIDGLIRSSIDGANLFLINPAGVMFGPNASLDVPASFHASTADYVKFSDGVSFYASLNGPDVLSVASPEAFGFLGSTSGAIMLDRSVLQVPYGQTLSLVGGPLSAENDLNSLDYFDYDYFFPGPNFFLLAAPGGTLNLVSVDSPGEVNLSQPDVSGFTQLGAIEFSNGANISVSDPYWSLPAGTIVIRGGNILFQDCGIPAVAEGIDAIGSPAGLVDIAGDSLHLDNTSVGLFNIGDDKIGDVARFDLSGDLLMTNGSYIDSSSWWGDAGHIDIAADMIKFGDDDPTSSPYADFGFYGFIKSLSDSGSEGRGGNISLNARDITVQNGFFVSTASAPDDGYYGPGYGDAGDISVQADTLQLLNKGQIVSNAYGLGLGGTVDVTVQNILISDINRTNVANNDQLAGIAANTLNSSGGKIHISADSLQLLDGGQVATTLWGSGTGADVAIDAKSLLISGFVVDETFDDKPYGLSSVDGRVFGADATGNGGNITVNSDHLVLENAGTIRTGLFYDASGNAGNIEINANDVHIASLGQIYADSFRGTGDSGNITINAGSMNITGTGDALPPEPLEITFTGISTTTNAGSGGTITATLSGDLTLDNSGGIKADTQGVGAGGDISLAARNLYLREDANINSSSAATGDAGNINLTGTDTLEVRNSSITTAASEDSDGGNIIISMKDLLYLYFSEITSSVGGGPETTGGNIAIDPEFVVLNHSRIVANAFEGTGGNIKIVADTFLADPESIVDASSELGVSGTVDIQAPIASISGLISPLSSEFVSALALLKERCIARLREGGKYSSFVVGGRDGLPIEPGNLLPSTFF